MNFTPKAAGGKNGTESAENCLQLNNMMLISSETFSFFPSWGCFFGDMFGRRLFAITKIFLN